MAIVRERGNSSANGKETKGNSTGDDSSKEEKKAEEEHRQTKPSSKGKNCHGLQNKPKKVSREEEREKGERVAVLYWGKKVTEGSKFKGKREKEKEGGIEKKAENSKRPFGRHQGNRRKNVRKTRVGQKSPRSKKKRRQPATSRMQLASEPSRGAY